MIRFFDLIFSILGLIVLSPVLIIIIFWILIDSSGPIIFKQQRVGLNGKNFNLFKFRSMFVQSDNKNLLTIGRSDPRITHSGLFIRKYKLDELPQLVNVVIGDMSLVGPRPEVRKYVDLYSKEQKVVLSIKPGLTDYASIKFINENELLYKSINPEKTYIEEIMPLKIQLNMVYINHPSLKQYFSIIMLTLKKLF